MQISACLDAVWAHGLPVSLFLNAVGMYGLVRYLKLFCRRRLEFEPALCLTQQLSLRTARQSQQCPQCVLILPRQKAAVLQPQLWSVCVEILYASHHLKICMTRGLIPNTVNMVMIEPLLMFGSGQLKTNCSGSS